ncbi:hypothetical protein BJ138DRAFT_104783 [Hygrophoropsis aurantiaca]|uniref:Uncharacterized protein n=1 Tax=Hygrophoropsis aurantiaca TaxID=72124 RepID=A0ACB8AAK5_9AGAM|nr:hypothetical protein BJ138DRAFT_104783 [Hygrophoropsis aurantiaca]
MLKVELDVAAPVSLHVYRRGGLLGDHRIVMAADKVTTLYYMHCKRSISQWTFSLFANGPHGVLICEVASSDAGNMYDAALIDPFIVRMKSERLPIPIERRNGLNGTHWFKGPDHNEYRWKSSSYRWKNDIQCLDAHNNVVATYRVTTMAINKDGELCVYPPGQFMIDLLVATTLAMRTPNH